MGTGWLVLSRKEGEELIFDLPSGETIRVFVAKIGDRDRKKVRLGIKAPANVQIWSSRPLRRIR